MQEEEVVVESIQPTDKQALAFMSPAKYVLYGGSMGGGKSTWLCAYAQELSMRYPGNRGYLCRHEMKSFRKTTLETFLEHLPFELLTQHHKTENYFRYKNGSIIYYGGLGDDLRAIDRLKSLELGWFAIDQAEETSEPYFFMLISRLRLKLPGIRYKGLMTANPSPGWVKSRFIDQQLPNHEFIPARPEDNPHLYPSPEEYVTSMRDVLPADLAQAWIDGDWNVISDINIVYPAEEIAAAMSREIELVGNEREALGADIAEYGPAETVISKKKGLVFTIEKAFRKRDPMESTGEIIETASYDKEIPINIDVIGPGSGVYARLKELGYNARPIRGSEKPSPENRERFKNQKTENYFLFRDVLPACSLPNDPILKKQMETARYRRTSDGMTTVESKEELRRRRLPSPDRLESIVYANASPYPGAAFKGRVHIREAQKKPSELSEEEREQVIKRHMRIMSMPPGFRDHIDEQLEKEKGNGRTKGKDKRKGKVHIF